MRNLLAIIAATCGMACGAATGRRTVASVRLGPTGTVSGVPPRPAVPVPGRAGRGLAGREAGAGERLADRPRSRKGDADPAVARGGHGVHRQPRCRRRAGEIAVADLSDGEGAGPDRALRRRCRGPRAAQRAGAGRARSVAAAAVDPRARARPERHGQFGRQLARAGRHRRERRRGRDGQRLATAIAKETKGTVSNRMAVATPNQVNIRVKVAEVNREVLKSLGVNWRKPDRKASGSNTAQSCYRQSIDHRTRTRSVSLLGGGSAQTLAMLDALAQENLLVTLAEPNLTATNGQPAAFLAGGEFPVPVASTTANGVPTITVEFKPFGVALDVTPTIIDPEHLVLRIRSEVSELSTAGAITLSERSDPRADRAARRDDGRTRQRPELRPGGSAAGQPAEHLEDPVARRHPDPRPAVPLGAVPAKRDRTGHHRHALSRKARPVGMLATPADGFRAPHDAQRVIDAGVYRQGLPAPPVSSPRPARASVGPIGFRLD